jgi:Fe-S cluster assembly protein SufD
MAPRSGAPTLSLYPAELSAALPGPEWLQRRRAAAVAVLEGASLPSADEEIWRYSRIGELDLDRFTPASKGWRTSAPGAVDLDDERASLEGPTADHFTEANEAFAPSPLLVSVPAGKTITEPIFIEHHIEEDGVAAFTRLVIDVGPNAECTIVERFSSADVTALVVPVTLIRAQAGSRVRYLAINELGPKVWQIAAQRADGDRDSSTLLASVALGGDYARVRTEARLVGQGADGRQIALYYGDAHQMHDFRTKQEHIAPRTTSDLLFKGAVQDQAHSVYTGLIKIGHDAKGSIAFQTNRNLKLSDGAWAESVPNLEIDNNDVRCSHASAIGPIDSDQRFYLESRGVPPAVAERLIVLGFFDDVIGRLPVASVAERLRREVAGKLDRRPR